MTTEGSAAVEAEPDLLQLLVRLLKLAEENALLAALAGAFALLEQAPRSLAQVRQPARSIADGSPCWMP